MKRIIGLLAAGMLVGCEGAVLVNNRPMPRPGQAELQQPQEAEAAAANFQAQTDADMSQSDLEAQQAGSTIDPAENYDAAEAADEANDRPADQTVETSNIRIESKSQ